ncbi:hypothetical protein DFH06DRAFT_1197615 [Mycena polygramma]|nr:hypothetical protein DFH06DRAFT_1197615 [Mycena polygramma]
MPFSRLRLFYFNILSMLQMDSLPTPATTSPATPLFFPVPDVVARAQAKGLCARRPAFSQYSARELRQILLETADLCAHLCISRVEYFCRPKAATPSFLRIWYHEITRPEIANYMILAGLDQSQGDGSAGVADEEEAMLTHESATIYISRRRRKAHLARIGPGKFTKVTTLDAAADSAFSVAGLIVLAAWLSESVPEFNVAAVVWTEVLPVLLSVAPETIADLKSKLTHEHPVHSFEKHPKVIDAARLRRHYDAAWRDFKSCVDEQTSLNEMNHDGQMRARELIEMRRKTREAAEIRRQHAKGAR